MPLFTLCHFNRKTLFKDPPFLSYHVTPCHPPPHYHAPFCLTVSLTQDQNETNVPCFILFDYAVSWWRKSFYIVHPSPYLLHFFPNVSDLRVSFRWNYKKQCFLEVLGKPWINKRPEIYIYNSSSQGYHSMKHCNIY